MGEPLLGAGIGYGLVWLVLGALLVMPLWLSVTADPMMRDVVRRSLAGPRAVP